MRPAFEAFHPTNKFQLIVEIGVKEGVNAKNILNTFTDIHYIGVDIEFFKEAKAVLDSFPMRARYVIADSVKYAYANCNLEADIIYIDGDHTLEGCLMDLASWYPLLRRGGLFAGHDYFNETCDVKKAVDLFAERIGVDVCTHDFNGKEPTYDTSDWWFIKP